METKKLILSSAGLKNIIFTNTKDFSESEEFRFILGEEELKTKNLFAEFISPRVSRIHQIDPTLNYLNLTDRSGTNQPIDKRILSTVDELSRGNKIEVTEGMIQDLQRISILLGNEELFNKINELYSSKDENDRISNILLSLQFLDDEEFLIQRSEEQESIIDYISSHFYLIEEEKLLKIPKRILYMIINNEHLKLRDEDSLFDFINKLFYSEHKEEQEQEKEEKEYENNKI